MFGLGDDNEGGYSSGNQDRSLLLRREVHREIAMFRFLFVEYGVSLVGLEGKCCQGKEVHVVRNFNADQKARNKLYPIAANRRALDSAEVM